jgi:hypothetical protein
MDSFALNWFTFLLAPFLDIHGIVVLVASIDVGLILIFSLMGHNGAFIP